MVTASPGAVAISLIALVILIFWERLSKQGIRFFQVVPAALVVVPVGVGLNQFFGHYLPAWYLGDSNEPMVRIPVLARGNGLSSMLDFPDFSLLRDAQIYGIAATIALVASLETLINLEGIDRIDPLRRVSSGSQELVAQGIGNMVSGLLGGLPVTSVVIRPSTNVYSGGNTRLATIIQGLLLVVSVLVAGSIINHIPLASLAALLIVIGYHLTRPGIYATNYCEGISQFIPFIVTVLGIVFTNLLIGILVGLAVGYLFVLYTNSQSSYRVIRDGKNVLIKFQKDVYFLSKPRLKETLRLLKPGDSVLIDGRYANFIDRDIYALLIDHTKTAQTLEIDYDLREVTQHKRNVSSHAAVREITALKQSLGSG
jgi:MFS superfamily sulfate permease-like transporter